MLGTTFHGSSQQMSHVRCRFFFQRPNSLHSNSFLPIHSFPPFWSWVACLTSGYRVTPFPLSVTPTVYFHICINVPRGSGISALACVTSSRGVLLGSRGGRDSLSNIRRFVNRLFRRHLTLSFHRRFSGRLRGVWAFYLTEVIELSSGSNPRISRVHDTSHEQSRKLALLPETDREFVFFQMHLIVNSESKITSPPPGSGFLWPPSFSFQSD